MNIYEIAFIAFGAANLIYGCRLLYYYLKRSKKLKNNYWLGILLFWVIILLPIIRATNKVTLILNLLISSLVVICTLERSIIALIRMELAETGKQIMEDRGQMFQGFIYQFIVYSIYIETNIINIKLYFMSCLSVVVYFWGTWYYKEKLSK